MSNWKSARYAKCRQHTRREAIAAYYRHKAESALIPENENVAKPKIKHSLKITLKFQSEPQMTLTVDLMPWGAWSVSPTEMGKKIQQSMLGFKKSDA